MQKEEEQDNKKISPPSLERQERLRTKSFLVVSCLDTQKRLVMVELISLFSNVSAQLILDAQTVLQHLKTFTSPVHLVCNFSSMIDISFESCFQMLQKIDSQLFAQSNEILKKHVSRVTVLCNPDFESLFSVFINIFNPPIPLELGTIVSR